MSWASMAADPPNKPKKEKFDFRFKTRADNLYLIFGTNKLFRMLSPSLRSVPFTGIEWAFLMSELGYN